MKSYDLFGTTLLSPDELRDRVAALLGVEFRGHDSYYLGEYHRWDGADGESILILTNEADPDGELLEADHAEWPVVLRIDGTSRPEYFRDALVAIDGLTLLRTTVA